MGFYYALVWLFHEACATMSTKGVRNIQEGEKRQREEMTTPNTSTGILPVFLIIFDLIMIANPASLSLTLNQGSEWGVRHTFA